jgi:hypothetical protein
MLLEETPMSSPLFQTQLEQTQHEKAISGLCHQYPGQEEFIRHRYLENLTPLLSGAKIRTYLTILTVRKVKRLLEVRH